MGLLVLGVVVLAVLLQIAPFARRLDASGDVAPPLTLERGELDAQRFEIGGGHQCRVIHIWRVVGGVCVVRIAVVLSGQRGGQLGLRE